MPKKSERKTTKVRFCQLPKGVSTTTLTWSMSVKISESDLVDVYVDVIKNPHLLRILIELDMAVPITINGVDDKSKDIYIVKLNQSDKKPPINLSAMTKIIVGTGNVDSPEELRECIKDIMGIEYILGLKSQFGVDVVVLEGNV